LSKYDHDEFNKRMMLSQKMFYAIERKLRDFLDYVPLDSEHLNVYSLKLVEIILETGPEVISSFDLLVFPNPCQRIVRHRERREELLEKERCLRKQSPPRSLSFKKYRDLLSEVGPDIAEAIVEIKELDDRVTPFEEKKPDWWNVYNRLKHDKYSNLKDATLLIALKSLAALYVLIYYHYDLFIDFAPVGRPEFISYLFKLSSIRKKKG